MKTSLRIITGLITLVCFGMNVLVNYHVVKTAAPEWFTMWAVSTSLFGFALLVNLFLKDDK